jgi:hypothetical protein
VLAGGAAAVQIRETSHRLPQHGDSIRSHGFDRLIRAS